MFRFASSDDRESLYELWHSCFGDGKDYVYPFLDTFLGEDNVYVCEEDGRIVSAVYALDCEIKCRRAVYFYAVATDKNYRKQGLARQEIEFLTQYKTKKGAEIFLLTPSNGKNRNYYEKLGFSDFFFCEKKTFYRVDEKVPVCICEDKDRLLSLRERIFGKGDYVSFPHKHFQFALRFSDEVFCEKKDGEYVSYAVVSGRSITELCCEGEKEAFVSSVLEKIGGEKAEIYIPVGENTEHDSCKIPRGMIYCSNKDSEEDLSGNTFLSLNLE